MECTSATVTPQYVPPPLGNGELSAMVDMEGVQRQKTWPGHLTPMIWWAGRRYATRLGELIPFGYVGQSTGEVASWRQRLDTTRACIETDCTYEDGRQIRTDAFAHLELPVLAFRKAFEGAFTFTYALAQPGSEGLPPEHMQILATPTTGGIDIAYRVPGPDGCHGRISFLCDRPATATISGNWFSLTVAEGPASFFLLFVDSIGHADVAKASYELGRRVAEEGYDGLFASHCAAWSSYWEEGFVRLPSARQSEVYQTAQYHLRISATPWSMPTGIFGTHWHCRYFGFDEHFGFMGLATSGHLAIARRVPEFRHRVLAKAIARAYRYFGDEDVGTGARFHWETDEKGDDRTPPGFWLEHIFHMANIALSSWHYYRLTGDREFLADTGYPVISRCADFYRSQSLYQTGEDRLVVGKCTDLERLGAARENAYMTTCGVVATFRAAAAAAETLGIADERAAEWRDLASKLVASLPRENGRYIPYPECPQKSIAVFAGTFPYPAVASDDPLQARAIADFLAEEKTYGNMYPVGDSVCVWYAGWMGVAFARLGQLDRARICIGQAVAETNCFAEIFEISKPVHHPWFTTAEATFVQMVNESLLQSAPGEIRVLPGPGEDYAFRLPADGGVQVEAHFAAGRPERIALRASRAYAGQVIMPDGSAREIRLDAGETLVL